MYPYIDSYDKEGNIHANAEKGFFFNLACCLMDKMQPSWGIMN